MRPLKILIMGLPGAGKTTLARELQKKLGNTVVYDGDEVRADHDDWDFSDAGRNRQAERLSDLCEAALDEGFTAIASFVCPEPIHRKLFNADFTVFVDRVIASAYPDTNKIFVPPAQPDYVVTPSESAAHAAANILWRLTDVEEGCGPNRGFDYMKPTALVIGRFQPFHDGHRQLVLEGIAKYGQVCIGVRMQEESPDNPYAFGDVRDRIMARLADYRELVEIVPLPNIVDVLYGRAVGYKITKVEVPPDIEAISATKIRAGEKPYPGEREPK